MTRGLFGQLNEREADMAEIAALSANRLLGMINDLLDIGKFESGEMTASPVPTDVPPVLEGVAASLSALARLERKTILYEGPADSLEAETDPDLLRRIVENLTGNALRFSPPDSPVTITLTPEDDGFSVAVRDRGEGIPPEYLDRIFEKFVQVESRERGRKLGTGLGLTFCQHAARALGGEIGVESAPGEGSTFTVRLPG
jgi:signal transduction histidine kinase